MKLTTPAITILSLAAGPWLVQGRSTGRFYWPALIALEPPSSILRRQQALANRLFENTQQIVSSPRYEIVDNDEKFQLAVDVPGVKMEDIDVKLEDGYLTVSGRREAMDQSSRFTSKFSQTFSVDESVDVDKFTASLNNGVLVVAAPKNMRRLEENVRRIPIQMMGGDDVKAMSGSSAESIAEKKADKKNGMEREDAGDGIAGRDEMQNEADIDFDRELKA